LTIRRSDYWKVADIHVVVALIEALLQAGSSLY